jgi:hypothetical protein
MEMEGVDVYSAFKLDSGDKGDKEPKSIGDIIIAPHCAAL